MSGMSAVREVAGSDFGAETQDRRRPGRVDYRSPALVALMRDVPNGFIEPDPTDGMVAFEREDQMAPARGIAMGVVISGFAWAVIGASIWMLIQLQG